MFSPKFSILPSLRSDTTSLPTRGSSSASSLTYKSMIRLIYSSFNNTLGQKQGMVWVNGRSIVLKTGLGVKVPRLKPAYLSS